MRSFLAFLSLIFMIPRLVFAVPQQEPKYKLAVCAFFKQEAPFLKEWLEYHLLLGVEHFYLYNNHSLDNYLEVLDPYIRVGIVEMRDWAAFVNAPWTDPGLKADGQKNPNFWGYQLSAYRDCVSRACGVAAYIALIDIDEYIVPVRFSNWAELLNSPEAVTTGAFSFSWLCFGTSEIAELSEDLLMIEQLNKATDDPINHHQKCIYRPEAVVISELEPHGALLKPGYTMQYIHPNFIRVNHYYLRDRKNCLAKRCGNDLNVLRELENRFNKFDDYVIHQYIPLLKEQMHKHSDLMR